MNLPNSAAVATAATPDPAPRPVLWFTGYSGAGKTTISTLVLGRLRAAGVAAVLLDGDALRGGLNQDLGFSDADRSENVRRVGEVARLMADAGLLVLVALISPFRADRDRARALFEPGRFFEIHVNAPLAVAEARDPKGLYRQARQGQVRQFTGIASGYEPPLCAELTLDTVQTSAAEATEAVLVLVRAWLPSDLAANPGQAQPADP
jgi:adenylyl-sulfate kinase